MGKKLPNVSSVTMHGTTRWVMDGRYHLVKGQDGIFAKGKKEYFDDEGRARGRAMQIYGENNGIKVDTVAPAVVLDAQRGNEMLAPLGGSIVEACRREADRLKAAVKPRTSVDKAVTDWIAFKKRDTGIDDKTIDNYDSRTKRLVREFGSMDILDLVFDKLHKWIHDLPLAPITKMDYRDTLSELFDWCIRAKLIAENPCQDIILQEPRDKAVAIFTVDEVRWLFDAAKKADDDILRYFVLCTFVGLRPDAEAKKAKAEHLNGKILTVDSDKVGRIRYVELETGVKKWLKLSTWKGAAIGPNWERRWNDFRYRLGFDLWMNPKYVIPERPADIEVRRWPHDVLRHTFCSYHLAAFQNEALTISKAGHTHRMFRKHYRRPIPPSEGEKFWDLVR